VRSARLARGREARLSAMPQTERHASLSKHRKGWRIAWFFVLPFLSFYGLFLIYPAIQVAYLSLTNADIAGQGKFIGLANYIELARDQDFWASIWHTLYFIVLTVVPNTAVGFLFALLVVRLRLLRLWVLSAFFLPYVLPVSVVTTAALWLLDANFGVINYLTGSTLAWFADPAWAMPGVALVTIWWTVGFNMLLFVAGLQNIPSELYEAAAQDGASALQRFSFITCPLIWPVTSLVLLLQLILQFKIFDQVYLLTLGGPYNSTSVVLFYMYRLAFQLNRGGYAATVAIVLVAVIIVGSALQFRLLSLRRK
jgi:multiple sugar transport system permease protein